ncbi:hypothetical protein [Amycolatopsis eburnea]|uniref:hypothetical protein n=1 Tax=Amycolatopsis eburnea TaxID=2267691 RepID=UPI0013154E51|nr:hypothetical protein [Amycolatopsis eburnea]
MTRGWIWRQSGGCLRLRAIETALRTLGSEGLFGAGTVALMDETARNATRATN